MISTHYYPPLGLPMMSLTIKDGQLVALDWYYDKTIKLFHKLNENTTFIDWEDLQRDEINQATALLVMTQLDEYFKEERTDFDVPLDLSHGTDFQIKVWQALREIPYGQTINYKELAARIGNPNAHRACANANGKNLISLIVPCHRVIASDGMLGGYTGGVDIKKKLLQLEKSAFKEKAQHQKSQDI